MTISVCWRHFLCSRSTVNLYSHVWRRGVVSTFAGLDCSTLDSTRVFKYDPMICIPFCQPAPNPNYTVHRWALHAHPHKEVVIVIFVKYQYQFMNFHNRLREIIFKSCIFLSFFSEIQHEGCSGRKRSRSRCKAHFLNGRHDLNNTALSFSGFRFKIRNWIFIWLLLMDNQSQSKSHFFGRRTV